MYFICFIVGEKAIPEEEEVRLSKIRSDQVIDRLINPNLNDAKNGHDLPSLFPKCALFASS